jgi:MoaA/NifB/PqqE/SkfB family radical SAM enzyme
MMSARSDLLQAICFRVTRYCNARCGFCLAPPDGTHPDAGTLMKRIDWLLAHRVRTIHFCGGEPTIHPAIGKLVDHVHMQGAKTKLTTNGIVLSSELISVLRNRRTEVKVSLHGNKEHHDRIVGRKAFDQDY